MLEDLEIFTDASLKDFKPRVFTCSGALCINTNEERYVITPDSTNNRGELLGIYLGVQIAKDTRDRYPGRFGRIIIYSDSQFAVFGLRDWMSKWLASADKNGVMYGSSKTPVKNQNLFGMIITYCVMNKLIITLFNQRGHVNTNSPKDMALANRQFLNANGVLLRPEEIFKISFYNDIVDKNTRVALDNIDPDDYIQMPHKPNYKTMCRYVIPKNFKNFIR